ncbi:transposase [Catalinimonas alkaloidigena]|uniref:IS630 family transposase n=1 Tax=Catalinimonas alkaloidigena TaxID=1075417 RepID=UPI002404C3DC|nr:IS630 family transposase [Catalinimonas alkaloidigena]MDF9796232.1 transposase [Catalinimonas alkaloidigena]
MRRSLKSKRDAILFSFFKEEIKPLKALEEQGELDLYYFDEAGVNLTPAIPYAWQPKETCYELPSSQSQNLTILGSINKECQCQSFLFDGAANSSIVIACLDAFAEQITKKTVVVLDRASIHTSKKVAQNISYWKQKGLFLQYIPPYCPELNQIEILWKFIKYYWFDLQAYQNMEGLKKKRRTTRT